MRSLSYVAALITLLGCAQRQSTIEPSATMDAHTVATGKSCEASRVGEQDKSWLEMKGEGFTYCVPANWEPLGARGQRWRSSTVDLVWDEQSPFGQRAPFVNTARGQSSVPFGTRVVTERVDGRTVRLEVQEAGPDGTLASQAQWLEPSLRLYGRARTATAADEILTVVRSVRFAKKSG